LDILTLSLKGLSQRAIVRKLGISRTTVKKHLENPELALGSTAERNRKSQLDPFVDNIEAWLNEDPFYSATWIYDRLRPMGFCGSYEIVKRRVGKLKNQRQAVA